MTSKLHIKAKQVSSVLRDNRLLKLAYECVWNHTDTATEIHNQCYFPSSQDFILGWAQASGTDEFFKVKLFIIRVRNAFFLYILLVHAESEQCGTIVQGKQWIYYIFKEMVSCTQKRA